MSLLEPGYRTGGVNETVLIHSLRTNFGDYRRVVDCPISGVSSQTVSFRELLGWGFDENFRRKYIHCRVGVS